MQEQKKLPGSRGSKIKKTLPGLYITQQNVTIYEFPDLQQEDFSNERLELERVTRIRVYGQKNTQNASIRFQY